MKDLIFFMSLGLLYKRFDFLMYSCFQVCGRQNLRVKVKIAPDVADALARGLPVVALESTIISHGLKFLAVMTFHFLYVTYWSYVRFFIFFFKMKFTFFTAMWVSCT